MEWPALTSPWVPIGVSLLPLIVAGLWKLVVYLRSDAKDGERRRRERDEAEAIAEFEQRKLLSADQAAWLDRKERECNDLHRQYAIKAAELDDAWKRVRRLEAELYARPVPPPDRPPFQM